MDYLKAFDKVPHGRLIVKLEAYNLHHEIICWIKEYLTLSEPQRPNQDSIWFDPNGQTRIPSGLTSTAEPGLIKFTVILCSLRDVINQ